MMKKYRQYANYKDCDLIWLNKIPEHWEINSFRNILVERNEKNSPIKSKERLSLSINKGVTLYADKTTNLDRFKDDFTKYKLAYEGDLVLNSMNMIVGAVGVSNYFGCVSPIYYTFTSDPNNCNSTKYYEYLFRSKIFQGVLFSLGRGLIAKDRGDGKYNTLRLKVSRGDLRSLKLPNPNYFDQTQIASFLNYKIANINRFIRKKKQLIEILNEQKAAIINQAVTKGIDSNAKMRPSGIEWLGEIPEHWEVRKLKYVAKIKTGRTPKIESSTVDFFENGNINWYTPGDFNEDGILTTSKRLVIQQAFDDKQIDLFPENTVYLVAIGGTIGKVGISENVGSSNQQINAVIFNSSIFPKFGYLLLKISKKQIDVLADFTTLPILNQTKTKEIVISFPNLKEQTAIVSHIEKETAKLNQTISIIDKEIALVEEYKTALIAEVVTGKIDVRDFEIPEMDVETLHAMSDYENELEEELNLAAEDELAYNTQEIE